MNAFLKNFARNFVKNLGTIIKAAIFSLFIWFFISIQIFPDITLHVSGIKVKCEPTAFMNEENLHIISVDTQNVTIQIQGKRYDISTLTSDNFVAECDLSGVYESGEHIVHIDVQPTEETRCDIISNQISAKVKVVKIVSREIEVVPNTSDLDIAEEMQIEENDVAVTPSVVTVTGEEKLVNSIGRIEAIAEYAEELDRTTEVPASLIFFNNSSARIANPAVTVSSSDFMISVPVYKMKTLPVSVKFTNTGNSTSFNLNDLDYDMSISEITIASPDSSVDNIDAVDIGTIALGTLTLKDLQVGVSMPVKLPDGYKNISGNKTITVTFPDSDSYGQLGFTVPSENISIINPPSNYNIKVLTNELVVNVVGLSNYIQEMTSADIYATVNLLGVELNEGTKSVSVTFRLSGSNVKAWVTGEEYKVELLITANEENE